MARVAVRFDPGTVAATGLIAGIIFAAFEMLAAAALMGPELAAKPLRMIGAMVLGGPHWNLVIRCPWRPSAG